MARVVFVEPFYGGSHRAFLDGLVAHSHHEIVALTLPATDWRRRMRLGAQELAAASAALSGSFDALIATDMLDLPVFLALTRPRFSALPVMMYFHENQFTYPRIRGTKFNSWFGQVNYLSALSASQVAFNSAFHRDDFVGALRSLSAGPNNWLNSPSIETIAGRSRVLPVGVALASLDRYRTDHPPQPPTILWNHRWEFDKGPAMFARAIHRLAAEGHEFRLALAGDPGNNPHPALGALAAELPSHVAHAGYVNSREAYARLLWQSDIAVSTTRHEFFGVGMVEALYCGCFPIAPDAFNYPALVPRAWHGESLFHDEEHLHALLVAALACPSRDTAAGRLSAAKFDWSNVAPQWDAAIEELAKDAFTPRM